MKALSPVRVALLQKLILLFGAGVGLQLFDNGSGDCRVHIDLTEQNLSEADKQRNYFDKELIQDCQVIQTGTESFLKTRPVRRTTAQQVAQMRMFPWLS